MGWTIKDLLRTPGRIRDTLKRIAFGAEPIGEVVRWQHEDTGRICELPEGKNPGSRWHRIPSSGEFGDKDLDDAARAAKAAQEWEERRAHL